MCMAGVSRFGQLQNFLFNALESGGALTLAILTSGGIASNIPKSYRRLTEKQLQKKIFRSVAALKRRRLVSIYEKDGQEYMILTSAGKQYTLRFRVQDMTLTPKKTWDGVWHLVMFDIPEKHGKARRALSSKIKNMGALPLQKSVFIYPYPWRDEIDFISEFFHVSSYVRYVEAKKVEGEKELKKHFNLS